MKTIFLTLGWSTTPAVSAVVRHGIEKGDELILLVPSIKDKQAEIAINDLKNLASKISMIELNEIIVSLVNFPESVTKIQEELNKRIEKKCIVNLSGGMRALVLATFMACMLCDVKDLTVEIEAENRAFILELPLLRRGILEKIPKKALELLQLCFREEKSIVLRQMLKVPASTFHEYITLLEKMNLLKRQKKGRSYNVKLTELGQLIAKVQ